MTKKLDHTPAPWKMMSDKNGFFWIDKVEKDGGFSICNIGKQDAEGNALLISKAPDLLYNLKRMTTCLGQHLKDEAKEKGVKDSELCPCKTTELRNALRLIKEIEGKWNPYLPE